MLVPKPSDGSADYSSHLIVLRQVVLVHQVHEHFPQFPLRARASWCLAEDADDFIGRGYLRGRQRHGNGWVGRIPTSHQPPCDHTVTTLLRIRHQPTPPCAGVASTFVLRTLCGGCSGIAEYISRGCVHFSSDSRPVNVKCHEGSPPGGKQFSSFVYHGVCHK